ncbi:MAG: ABC transporter substrate-binding protein [Roseburia sp.]|nr:ABC transporter substrate-binding protein [Roseburia sp.]MCM1242672.1 ABC transporter substrate-binding protein [Roseburia sp.]
MKNRQKAAYFTMALIFTLTGCSAGRIETPGGGNSDNTEISIDESSAMGRYVEESLDISDRIGYGCRLFQLEDGSLIITDKGKDFLCSTDRGATWEADPRDWRTAMAETETYIQDFAVGADNTVGVIYEVKDTDADAADNLWDTDYELLIVRPDGSQVVTKITPTQENDSIRYVWISDTGRVFVSTYGTEIYEVKEDGSTELFLVLDPAYAMPHLIQFQGNLMIIDGDSYDGLLIYDMEKEIYIEDEVLNDFINANYQHRTNGGGSFYDLYFFFAEEDILYLAGEKGLHRHVIGGSAMEQVIDGNLTIFSNPSYALQGMVMLDNSEFLALFQGGSLVRFTYDPNIPTVPSETLTVYSLRDNNTIRQAVNLYQSAHPEYYVEYKIGMEDGSSITREDALKNLNTQIMAGEGPDVLILDNLPIDAYLEKGMLLDLTPFLESLEEEDALFENIVDAFRVEDKVYMLPCEVGLPLMLGMEDYLPPEDGLSGIADVLEVLRQENPGDDLLGVCSEKRIMRLFSVISTPYWKTSGGDIDKEALTDYYVQAKRIYDAQMESLPEETIIGHEELNDYLMEMYGYDPDDSSSFVRLGINYLDYATGMRKLECAVLVDFYEYMVITSMQQMEEHENLELRMMDENIFYPQTLAAIAASSDDTQAAEEFLRLLLGDESQSSLFNGLPVNKAAFNDIIHGKGYEESLEDGDLGSLMFGMGDGDVITINIIWPEEEQMKTLQGWMESVGTPCIDDDILEDAVYEEGVRYLHGTQSVEEAVEAVERTVALYMAE